MERCQPGKGDCFLYEQTCTQHAVLTAISSEAMLQTSVQEGAIMSKFGLYGKIIAQPGQRDALVEVLLEAAAVLETPAGCELYIINVSPTEPDTVWVTEVWESKENSEPFF
jgi:hypothetical protein